MKIIFTGIHNKTGLLPLDSSTLAGKRIDKIIQELPKDFECIKSNLFNIDFYPCTESDKIMLKNLWLGTYRPAEDDLIVLLGKDCQREFVFTPATQPTSKVLKIEHPSSRWIRSVESYVRESVNEILGI